MGVEVATKRVPSKAKSMWELKDVALVPPFAIPRVPVNDESERQLPETAKQPAARLRPPVPYSEEVAVVRFVTPCTEKSEPGVEVPIPTRPLFVIVNAGVVEVANVEGEEVAR